MITMTRFLLLLLLAGCSGVTDPVDICLDRELSLDLLWDEPTQQEFPWMARGAMESGVAMSLEADGWTCMVSPTLNPDGYHAGLAYHCGDRKHFWLGRVTWDRGLFPIMALVSHAHRIADAVSGRACSLSMVRHADGRHAGVRYTCPGEC